MALSRLKFHRKKLLQLTCHYPDPEKRESDGRAMIITRKRISHWALILLGITPTSHAQEPGFNGNFTIEISPWTADCDERCGVPRPAGPPTTIQLPVKPTRGPGSAARGHQDFTLPFGETRPSHGRLTIYSIHPAPASGQLPYIQARVDLHGAVEAVCATSVRWRSPMEISPLICAGRNPGGPRQQGVTTVFKWNR